MANNSEASVGLRVYLNDQISSSLLDISDLVGVIGKDFLDFGDLASSSFNDLIDYTRLATESLVELNDVLMTLGQSTSGAAAGTTQAADATKALADADQQEADAADNASINIERLNVSIRETITMNEQAAQTENDLSNSFGSSFLAAMAVQQVFGQLNQVMQSAVTQSGDLQDSFVRAGIATKATTDEVNTLDNAIVQFSDQGIYSTMQVSDAFQELGQLGYSVTDIVQNGLGNAVLQLAEVTKTDLTPTAQLVAVALHDFGASASDATAYANALAYAAMNGIPDMNALSSALTRVGPSAESLKIPFNDVMSALIYLATHGMPDVSQAGTTLNYMLQAMAAPTSTAAKMLTNIGLSFYDMQGNLKPLPQMIQDLFTALAQYPNSQAAEDLRALFNIRSGAGARIMGGDGNITQDLGNISNNLSQAENGDYLGQQITKLRGDFNQTLGRLTSTWNSTVALLLLPVVTWITPLLDGANRLISALSLASPQAKNFIAILGGILLVAGPILAIGGALTLFGVMLGAALAPFLLLVGAVAALAVVGALVAANWSQVTHFFAPLEPVLSRLAQGVHAFLDAFSPGTNLFKSIMSLAGNLASTFDGAFGPALGSIQSAWVQLQPALGDALIALKAVGALVAGVLVGVFGGLMAVIRPLAQALGVVLSGAMMILAGAINVVAGIVRFFINAIGGIAMMFVNPQKAAQMFQASLAGLGQAAQGVGQILAGIFTAAFGIVRGILTVITSFVLGFVNGIVGFFQHLADVLVGHSIIPDMANAILKVFTGLVSLGKALIQDLVNGVIAIFTILIVTPVQSITQMIQNIGTGLANGSKAIGGWVSDHIVTPIKNGIESLLSLATGWGSNLINMFINGIKNAIGGLGNALGNVANTVKNFLGFHSPTKEGPLSDSDQYAPSFMRMFANGITTNAHLVHTAAISVANGVRSNLSSPTIAAIQASNARTAGGYNQGQMQTINLNIDGKTVGTVVFNSLTGQMQLNGLNRAWR